MHAIFACWVFFPAQAPSANGDTQSYAAGFLEGALTHTRSASVPGVCPCDMETNVRLVDL